MRKKIIILSVITSGLFIIWKFTQTNFYREKAKPAQDYIYREFFKIDSLKSNALHIDTMKLSINQETLSFIEEERKEICKSYRKTGLQNIKKHPYHDSFTEYKNYKI